MKTPSVHRSHRRSHAVERRERVKSRRRRRVYVSGQTSSQGVRGNRTSRRMPSSTSPTLLDREAAIVTIRRSTVVRAGLGAVVLVALGVGFGLGLALSSSPRAMHNRGVVTDAASTPGPSESAATTDSAATAAALLPAAESCTPGVAPQERPTSIDIGCGGRIAVSGVTWSSWGPSTGSGSGTLTVNDCQPTCATGNTRSLPAFVVVSRPSDGIFQDVVITPPPGDMAQQASSHPGSGWGWG